MIRINLLPYWEFKKKEQAKRLILLFAAAGLAFAVLLLSFHVFMVLRLDRLEGKVEQARNRLVLLTKITSDLDQYKMDADTFKKKIGVIEKLEKGRTQSAGLLSLFSTQTPKGQMWLTFLSKSGDAVRVEGMALNNAIVADFMNNLEGTGRFRSVDLLSAKQAVLEGVKLMNFMISCQFEEE